MTYPEPPTKSSISSARSSLEQSIGQLEILTKKIADAEAALQRTIAQAQLAIDDLRKEKTSMENQISLTRCYLAPVRTLPTELLGDIFTLCFEGDSSVAWVLAAVCRTWRNMALGMHKIWSKIRLTTTQSSSPEVVRLWLERSGRIEPLDIQIFVRRERSNVVSNSTRMQPTFPTYLPGSTIPSLPTMVGGAPLVVSPFSSLSPWDRPRAFIDSNDCEPENEHGATPASRNRIHWAHIAFAYLVEQMHRWERFVFRFDTHFPSIDALKTIFGDAPHLKEFEISAASEAMFPVEWCWLPNLEVSEGRTSLYSLPKLRALTLQLVPFRSTSPLFHTGLHTLNLYSLSPSSASLDRLLHVLKANRMTLQRVSFYFREVTMPIIPLTPLTLPELKELSLGKHQMLADIIDVLTLPSLEELNIDFSNTLLQQTISSLTTRSGGSALAIKHLSVGYGFGCGHSSSKSHRFVPSPVPDMYGGRPSFGDWRAILEEMTQLESLRVSDDVSSHLLDLLTPPEASSTVNMPLPPFLPHLPNTNSWICPNLSVIGIKGHNLQTVSTGGLVRMVDARNPAGGGNGTVVNGVAPKKLQVLELYECSNARQEVKEWFQSKVEHIVITEPVHSRINGPLQHTFA